MALFVLSLCPFDISVGVGAFVIGLSQISSFFSVSLFPFWDLLYWAKTDGHSIIMLIRIDRLCFSNQCFILEAMPISN